MIKMIMCLKRNPNLSREEFQEYWKNSHGKLFMKNAHVMRTKRYLQSHTLNSPLNNGLKASRGMMDGYDGVAEVWFESEEELMEAMGSDEAAELGEVLLLMNKNSSTMLHLVHSSLPRWSFNQDKKIRDKKFKNYSVLANEYPM